MMAHTASIQSGGPRATFSSILQRMESGTEDCLVLVRDLVMVLIPRSSRNRDEALRRWRELIALLEDNAGYRRAMAAVLFTMLAESDQRSFYAETGLLPNTGFFSELRQILIRKVLPEPIDTGSFLGRLRFVFTGSGILHWLRNIPQNERDVCWKLLTNEMVGTSENYRSVRDHLLDAALIVAHRIAAMGLEPELLRAVPRLGRGESPFIALCDEATFLTGQFRAEKASEADDRHLHVLFEQCRYAVERIHQSAASHGTSFLLTFLLVRLRQHLERLELLLALAFEPGSADDRTKRLNYWINLVEGPITSELERNRLHRHTANTTALIALRVTENAGNTGEHYIAANRAEWLGMWRAAAGAGFLIAFMALTKIHGAGLHLAVLSQGFLNGIIYAGGFISIHLCHGTVATKQPAMTAATIAATVSQSRGRLKEIDQLADLVVATARTQFAAIVGNVMVALPLALAIALAMQLQLGEPVVSPLKAKVMLKEINPLGGACLFAAVAGVWLFMAGLVSGLVDNQAAYGRLGDRLACHPRLVRLLGKERAARLGSYLDRNAGGLAGNLFFGMMLGLTPAFGLATGLPLDIRHIAFSAANFGYAVTAMDSHVGILDLVCGVSGVTLIGATNLAVSFGLALWVALRSRGVDFSAAAALLPELKRRLGSKPSLFFVPPRD